jgi:hypothetical protein
VAAALEILLVADDLDGPRAERFRYLNRVIADDQLDEEVKAMASRRARFDQEAIARTKSYVNQVTLPADSDLPPPLADSSTCSGVPLSRHRPPGSRRSGSRPTATSNGPRATPGSKRFPTPESGDRPSP